ncbi:MAG: Rpn family recombination-promoting nuclease/putative transposase [Fibrobacter sp.]|nr:Rpn family recombination-promoting nuclease/putative transposase [Fibrobacter sp.]
MSLKHDKWYTRIFSDPKIIEELLRSFVHEPFVNELDFSSLKKLNTKFIPVSERSRHADVIFEITSRGQTAYIYLYIEFQSTVNRFMALRMARYLFEFYEEIQKITKPAYLNPLFPILIYNGDSEWDAPDRFSDLLHKSSIPKDFLPEFRYFKIAINEISKRDLVKIRNAVATIFYIENSNAAEIGKNRKELVSLLSAVLKKHGGVLVKSIVDRIYQLQRLPPTSKTIKTINDLAEVSSMLETRTKQWEERVLEKGIEQGIEQGIEINTIELVKSMKKNGVTIETIRKITGLSMEKIKQILASKK